MADYYVSSSTGNDGNPGTIGQPWRTLSWVSNRFAAGIFAGGDNIYLMRGDTWEYSAHGMLRIRGSSGSFGNYIYIGPYGSGADPAITRTAGGDDILIGRWNGDAAANYIELDSLDVSGAQDAANIRISDASYWIVRNCTIRDTVIDDAGQCAGLYVQHDSHHVWILNCEVYGCDGEGLYLGRTTAEPQSDYIGRVTVRDCWIHDCQQEAIDLKGVSWSCFIVDTDVEDCGPGSGKADEQVAVGGRWHRFMNMRIFGSTGSNNYGLNFVYTYSGQGCRYLKFDHCLLDGCGSAGGSAIYCRSDDNYITNCTIVGAAGDGVITEFRGWGNPNVWRNNIFDDIGDYPVYQLSGAAGDYDFDYNRYGDAGDIWYRGAGLTLANVQGGGDEANGTQGDPMFADADYNLAAGSPCIDDGQAAATVWDWNLEYGTGSPAGTPDMGWREYDWDLPHRVFDSQFNTLNDFTGSNNVAISAAAAYSGDYGGRLTVGGVSDYVYRDNLGDLDYLYTRLYFDPSGLTMANGDEFNLIEVQDNAGVILGRVELSRNAGVMQVRGGILDDANVVHWTGYHNVDADDWNQVELFWMRSVWAAGPGDQGEIILYVDAAEVDTVTGINNDTRQADEIWAGVVSGVDAGTSGTMDMDCFTADEVREIGSTIDGGGAPPGNGDGDGDGDGGDGGYYPPEAEEVTVFMTWQDTYRSQD